VTLRELLEGRYGWQLRAAVVPTPASTVELVVWLPPSLVVGRVEELAPAYCAELLGTETMRTWVSGLELGDPLEEEESLELRRLPSQVARHVAAFQDQRPERRCTEGGALEVPPGCTVSRWELEPEEREQYPDRTDLLTAETHLAPLLACTLFDIPVLSERYTRFPDERFWYLKLDGRGAGEAERFADLADLREAVEVALRDAGAGCTIGSGTGRIYSYVDLCLVDEARALGALRPVLQDGRVHRDSWLLPLDARDRGRWCGIWEDTPPPGVGPDQGHGS
jgi:hypothetical protein